MGETSECGRGGGEAVIAVTEVVFIAMAIGMIYNK